MSVIVGSSDSEIINGLNVSAEIYAGAGYDTVMGGESNDYIEGNRDNDYLLGGYGSDIYGYYLGDGDDQIWDYGNEADIDKLIFHDLNLSDLFFSKNGSTLLITVNQNGQTINITNGANGSAYQAMEQFQFKNGEVLSLFDIENLYVPSTYVVSGTTESDFFAGNGLSLQYELGSGDDILEAGAGSDYIFAGSGWDSVDLGDDAQRDFIFFSVGNERDYIGNFNFNNDLIIFSGFGDRQSILMNSSIYQDGTSTVIEFNNGVDLLVLSQTNVSTVINSLNNIGSGNFWFW
jgi:Ca2+-binding RTX toxin-like protein